MSFLTREETYIKLLSERERTVSELSKLLYVSEPTVRRDILILKERDLASSHAGRVKLKSKYSDQRIPLLVRRLEHTEAKLSIAAKAAHLISDGDTVMLDASTTAACLLPHIAERKNIILITNGAQTALEAAALGIKTICTGGELTVESFSYIGCDAETTLSRYNADVAFFSCRGISEDGTVTDNSIFENSIRRIMISNSKKAYLLCDKSKRGGKYLNTLCRTDELDGLIED